MAACIVSALEFDLDKESGSVAAVALELFKVEQEVVSNPKRMR